MPRFIEVARLKEKFTVQGTGKQLRSWLFVDDASDGIRLAAEKGRIGEVYNFGTYYEKNGKQWLNQKPFFLFMKQKCFKFSKRSKISLEIPLKVYHKKLFSVGRSARGASRSRPTTRT